MTNATAAVSSPQALAGLVGELKSDWRRGAHPDAARVVSDHPALVAHRTLMIDLAYEEYCLRDEAGAAPDIDYFCRQFPAHQSHLREVLRGYRQIVDHPELLAQPEAVFPADDDMFDGLFVVRELGRGAFARVYLVTDPKTGNRPVVLKLSQRPSREGQTLGANEHEHVVQVYWARNVDGFFAVCMPLVGATTLRDAIEQIAVSKSQRCRPILDVIRRDLSRLPFEIRNRPPVIRDRQALAEGIAAIAAPLARALAQLHRNGVCHGDLKPSNVLLGPGGYPYLIDFNLSSNQEDSALRLGGTLAYMAPERVRQLLDPKAEAGNADRADVYSFGAVLFECLTGKVPLIPADDCDIRAAATDMLRQHAEGRPPIRAIDPNIPGALADLIEACLDGEPEKRPSADLIAHVLTRYAGARARRNRGFITAGATALTALLLWLAVANYSPSTPAADVDRSGGSQPVVKPIDPFARGIEFLRADDIPAALKSFNDAFRINGDDGRAFAYFAYCNTRSGYHQVAADMYSKAIKKGYAPAWVHNDLAYSLIQAAPNDPIKLRQAMDQASIAHNLDPGHRGIEFNWAFLRFLTKQDEKTKQLDDPECLRAIRDVMAGDPRDAELCFKAGVILAASSSNNDQLKVEAIACLRQAVELGKPAGQLPKNLVLARFVGNHPDFRALIASPPPFRQVKTLHLELVSPPQ